MTRLSGGRKFADEFFDPKTGLFEPEELTDLLGTRFLARKLKDVPPHVPRSMKSARRSASPGRLAKARPLAEKAAQELAEQLKKKSGAIKDGTLEGYRVVTIPPITRRRPTSCPAEFDSGSPEETPIPDVAYAGESFRNAYFGLQPGSVAVAPNQPEPSITSWSPSVASRPPSPRSTPPTATSYATRCPPATRRPASSMSSGWAGCDNRPASSPTGSRPTRPRASRASMTTPEPRTMAGSPCQRRDQATGAAAR